MKSGLILVMLLVWVTTVQAVTLPAFEGQIEPREVVGVSSQVPGILEKIMVERGDHVQVGQILARLKSEVDVATVRSCEARVEFGKRKVERNVELHKKKMISTNEKDELETEVELAQLQLAEARARLDLRTIRSTINGVVVKRIGAPGEFVGEESFMTIAQISPLNVELVISVDFIGSIKEGMTAKVLPDEPVGGEYEAKVVVVDKVIDAASSTFGVRLELPNSQLKLPAGIKCRVVF